MRRGGGSAGPSQVQRYGPLRIGIAAKAGVLVGVDVVSSLFIPPFFLFISSIIFSEDQSR